MAGKIGMNTEDVTNTGLHTKKRAEDFEQAKNEFGTHVTNIRTGWTYPEAIEFEEKAEVLKNQLNQLAEKVKSTGSGFINTAEAFQDTSNENVGRISNV